MDTLRWSSTFVALAALLVVVAPAAAAEPGAPAVPLRSPYAPLRGTGATGLLPEEVEGLQKGQGMALALAAEANGYPGPRHVLDMDGTGGLTLSPEQRRAFERLYDGMLAEAKARGEEILQAEAHLAARFRHGHIDEASLGEILDRIGRLRVQLRFVHLRTHLAAVALLTPEQIARYRSVRGYDGGQGEHRPRH
jgi:Spy/CpxP family protein refolding chaperone